jgi:chemotaxis protein methyltransferase CheR
MPTEAELTRFAAAVATRLGLRLEVERSGEIVERRAAARDEPVSRYLDRVEAADPAEIRALASELTVGETYFLRHSEQFRAFIDVVVPDRLAHGRLRVLSAGCASGEEAYTLAMLLRESYPAQAFDIHAVDLNVESIARARAGRYSRWSLRATTPELEQRWFQRDGRDVVVVPELRSRVTFEQANLLDDGVLSRERWDVVFCRNVIMYFTDEQLEAVIARFARALAPGGYLFLGHAETLRDRTDDFALCHTHGAFYYQRHPATAANGSERFWPSAHRAEAVVALEPGWYDHIRAATERVHAMIDGALDDRSAARPPRRAVGQLPSPPDLTAIRELLVHERFNEALEQLDELGAAARDDRDVATLRALVLTHAGRFAEARAACRDLLALDSTSAGANYLLALCCDSTGDVEGAAQLAHNAAELDPSFAMPRVHLGLLARRIGARAVASRELGRAIVLLEREEPMRLALYGGGFSRQALLAMCRAELAAIGGAR